MIPGKLITGNGTAKMQRCLSFKWTDPAPAPAPPGLVCSGRSQTPPVSPPSARFLLSVESRLVPSERSLQVILEMKEPGNVFEGAGIGEPIYIEKDGERLGGSEGGNREAPAF